MAENYEVKAVKLNAEQQEKFKKLVDRIPEVLKSLDNSEYDEIYGQRINVATEPYVEVAARNEILAKFLVGDEYDVDKAVKRLVNSLNWRYKFQPLKAAFFETFDNELNELGLVTITPENKANLKVVTWNLYGNLKSPKKLFERYGGDGKGVEGLPFLRWRIGLMEKALQALDFADPDNNRIAQVHDYNDVLMLRMDPGMKSATKEIITIFQDNYPELLSIKLFINVPTLMGWVFAFFKTIGVIGAETLKKFQMKNNGDVSEWFGGLPSVYNGGKGDNKEIFKQDSTQKIELGAYGKELLKRFADEAIEKEINDVE